MNKIVAVTVEFTEYDLTGDHGSNHCGEENIFHFRFWAVISWLLLTLEWTWPALYLSGTCCHKTGTRHPDCLSPWQPTIYFKN